MHIKVEQNRIFESVSSTGARRDESNREANPTKMKERLHEKKESYKNRCFLISEEIMYIYGVIPWKTLRRRER